MDVKQQHECFEKWMADHIAILYRVVNGFAEGDDRNDLMQEVILAVWHAIPRFRAESKPTTFLYRVSHNAALSWRRTRHNYRRRVEQATLFAEVDSQPDHTPPKQPEKHRPASSSPWPSSSAACCFLAAQVSSRDTASASSLSTTISKLSFTTTKNLLESSPDSRP